MPRALTLGNGKILVGLDNHGFVRDFYYPYVGLENHVSGQKHRIGVKVNDRFSWLDDGTWDINIGYKPETMVGYLVCKNEGLKVTLVMEDIVYNESNIFVRQADLYNLSEQAAQIQIFFHQVFHISESKKRNTAFFDPTHNNIVHYKGERVFVVNGKTDQGTGIDEYSVGAFDFEGKEGTFKDAEDGTLGKNAVEHGSVDSVIRLSTTVAPKEKARVYYWICVAKSLSKAYELNDMVLKKTPGAMLHSTESYWTAWLKTHNFQTDKLTAEQKKLFDTSLFVIRCHVDNRGSIIAASDSEMMEWGKDDYSYMWPRDAAFIVTTLCKAGYTEATKPFFQFCQDVLHEDGYLHHRYRSDKSLGSTWHSSVAQRDWLKDRKLQLPIQEDESASVLVALWNYYQASKDLEFIETLYKPFIEKIAGFLMSFRDKNTGLPLHSYDLWEEFMGVSTYTCASVYGGLMAAAKFSELLDKRNHMRDYKNAAKEIQKAATEHLFNKEIGSFIRGVYWDEDKMVQMPVVDSSSLYGLWYFEMLDQNDSLFQQTHQQVQERLTNPNSDVGGTIRYEHDNYFKATDLSNPWFITTMWEAQRKMKSADFKKEDLEYIEQIINWVVRFMYPSGILAEQLNPYTGESLSATPLIWSHAVYVETILMYLQKKQDSEVSNQLMSDGLHVI